MQNDPFDLRDDRLDRLVQAYDAGSRNFDRADFSGTNFRGSFRDCSFRSANFAGAWIDRVTFDECNFFGASFTDTVFASCQLVTSSFEWAGAVGAVFMQGSITGCNFENACLLDAIIRETDLRGCNFNYSNLRFLMSDHAKIIQCKFYSASIERASFTNTAIDSVVASGADCGSGCTVDWSSICLSLRTPNLEQFLVVSGMPDVFVSYSLECALAQDMRGLFKLMRSTFISYGGPDEAFAGLLRDAIQRAGVRTFLFARDAKPGKKLHDVMRDGVAEYDRVVLICSRASLDRRVFSTNWSTFLRVKPERVDSRF